MEANSPRNEALSPFVQGGQQASLRLGSHIYKMEKVITPSQMGQYA